SNFTIIGPAVNETFRLEKVPDVYGLSVLLAGSTAEMIRATKSEAAAAGALGNNVLVRVDDLGLKGFAPAGSIQALVPDDDPRRAKFEAGRKALDEGRVCEGLADLAAVDSGMLQQAAKVVSARYQPAP